MSDEQIAELERIRLSNPEKMLVPSEVVAAARDKSSTLHSEFEWDDSVAANAYREQQARTIIRAVVIYEPSVGRRTRAYLSVPTDRADGGGYRKTSDILSNPDYVSQLVEEVKNKLSGFRYSYKHLDALDPLWDRIDATVATFLVERQKSRLAA